MTRPTQHPKTGIYRIRRAVPAALREAAGVREWIVNLGTKDPLEARRRAAQALAEIEAKHAAARAAAQPPRSLTHREVIQVAGEWYRDFIKDFEDDPGHPEQWAQMAELAGDQVEYSGDERDPNSHVRLSQWELEQARRLFRERAIAADEASVRKLAEALWSLRQQAATVLQSRAEGDYSPDPNLATLPEPRQRKPTKTLPAEDLLKAWAAERNPSAATLTKYTRAFAHVARILGFDDVRRITADDVVTFKQARLAAGIGQGTVADDVLACGAVCTWAVDNRMLPTNPFARLAPKTVRRGPAPRDPYTDEEAKRILTAAREETGWLRWAPWLLCFTGARVSEFAEMRRGHVRQDGGVWIFDMIPTEQREGKNATFQRMIPLHPAIIAEGFLDYLAGLPKDPTGPLFPDLSPDPSGSRVIRGTSTLARWMRGKVKIGDPRKAPAHSWRHRMEDELRKVRALPEVQDAITGRHNPRNAGAGYGKGFRGMPAEVLKDLEKVPSPVGAAARQFGTTITGRKP